ncbi:hypothetical protein GNX71_09405 [Variovorax sp. RKNM96]|uniref:Ig-like domain repeat protein n=1 Tax=Variovorax sp. RKNM96 TaxID=2681552 RepID=UPI001980001B|nr:Ig-like domain repeat protein [Variovorax sp. RKNM96]QSI29786.1 hypothetical protein GNX71_09405 [Variovorax sp. RKNM96]
MVAIVSGNSLGLSLSSLTTLGQRGLVGSAGQGRNGELAYVNAATGNLVLQNRDELLLGRGPDVLSARTYNSQGLLDDDNADNWRVGAFGQKVVLTGSVATVGSTLTRTDRDGAQAVYTWDAATSRYVSSAGAGAFDTIAHDAGADQFVWTDGDSGLTERYQATGQGRLVSVTDADGNTVSYAYNANANGTVQSLTDANGEITYYDYDGNQLTQIRSVDAGGASLTHVRYGYDASGRLSTVTVDLSPEDDSIADGRTYVTTYAYDGASNRIASVAQSDGTSLAFTYVQSGAAYKVASVTDALGAVTRFNYDAGLRTTTVTDPLGAQSVYSYDAQGQLLQLRQGVTANHTGGVSQVSYAYDAAGNVTRVTDGEGRKVDFSYDERGNLLKEVDSAGDTRVRTYGPQNQLLTDTVYADAATSTQAAALPETTRYVYAQGNPRQLRFAISAQGSVTEYRYDAHGQRTAAVEYSGAAYDTAGLAPDSVPSEAQLVAWQQTQNLAQTRRTDYVYDGRGALSSSTVYTEIGADGQGLAAGAATTQYIYDPRGLLVQKIEPGDAVAVTTYTYDGLGRVLSASGPSLDGGATANTTITSYDDANGKVTVTIASGLVTTSAYDLAGRLVSVTQQSAGTGVLGTTSYVYDKDGNLLMTQDPTGVRKWMLYDEADRKIADIDATGAVTAYAYNANGQLRQTIAYTNRIDTALLLDGAGLPTTAWSATNTVTSLEALRPASAPQDQKVWNFYDDANRLAFQVDGLGYVTQTVYDGASRVLSTTRLANPVDVRLLEPQEGAGVGGPPLPPATGTSAVQLHVEALHASTQLGGVAEVQLYGQIADGSHPLKGSYSFFDGQTLLGTAQAGGEWSSIPVPKAVGVRNITVVYSGDDYNASATTSIEINVVPVSAWPVLSVLGADANLPVRTDSLLALRLAVAPSSLDGLAALTGVATFYRNGVAIGTAQLIEGVASLAVSGLPAGMSEFTVSFEASNGSGANYAVEQAGGTSVEVWAPQAVATSGQLNAPGVLYAAVPFDLSVDLLSQGGSALTGSVTFRAVPVWGNTAAAQVLGTVAVINGRATFSSAVLLTGGWAIEADYAGDANNGPLRLRTGEGISVRSTTTVTSSVASAAEGETVTLSMQINGVNQPSGLVTFYDGTTVLGTAQAVNGVATLQVNTLGLGSHVIRAAYAGDGSNVASVAVQTASLSITTGSASGTPLNPVGTSAVQLHVEALHASTQLGGVAEVQLYGQIADGSHPLKGSYSFFDGQTLLGTAQAGGEWSSIPVPKAVGVRNITVVYSGDDYNASATTSIEINVVPVSAWPVLSVLGADANLPVRTDSLLALRLAVAPSSLDGLAALTGVATFYRNGVAIGTAQLIEGVASLAVSGLPAGMSEFTVSFEASNGSGANYAVEQAGGTSVEVWAPQAVATSGQLNAPGVLYAAVPFDLSVDLLSQGGSALTGSVTFRAVPVWGNTAAAQVLGTVAVINGRATFSSAVLLTGGWAIEADYAGDANNGPLRLRTGEGISVRSTTTVTSSVASAAEGETVTLSMQINGVNQPSGLVTFYDGTTVLGTAQAVNGVATLQVNTLGLGSHVIRAAYAGDGSNVASVAVQTASLSITTGSASGTPLNPVGTSAVQLHVEALHASTQLGGVAEVQLYGQIADGSHPLKGSYSFFDGQTLLGTAQAGGEWSSIPVPKAVGVRNITVVYSGDDYNASATTSIEINVVPVSAWPVLSVLGADANLPVRTDSLLALRLAVAPSSLDGLAALTGVATFYRNGVAIGTAQLIEGVASLAVSGLPAGMSEFTVSFEASNGSGANYAVEQAGGTSVEVWAPQAVATSGQLNAPGVLYAAVPFDLSVDLLSQGGSALTGSVTFRAVPVWGNTAAAQVLGTVAVINGRATFSSAVLLTGGWAIEADYAGDANNGPLRLRTGEGISVRSTTTVTSSVASAAEGETVTLSMQINGVNQPSGLVTFYDGTTVLGTAQAVNGVATLQVNTLGLGSHVIRAAYAGDGSNVASVAVQTASLSITRTNILPRLGIGNLSDIAVTLGVDNHTLPIGASVTLMANIAGASAGGMVTFFSGNTVLGSAPVIDGMATLVTDKLPGGVNNVRASYANGAQQLASISPAVQIIVTPAQTSAELTVSSSDLSSGDAIVLSMDLSTALPANLATATGEVRFYGNGALLGSATVIDGLAMLMAPIFSVGDVRILAVYGGDPTHEGVSAETQVMVRRADTETTLQVASHGASLRLSASVVSSSVFPQPLQGVVIFRYGDTVLGQASVVNGVAVLDVALPTGDLAYYAVEYTGDVHHYDSEGSAGPAATLEASATSAVQGDPVTLRMRVIDYSGRVSFFADDQYLGTSEIVEGWATLVTSYLPVGSNIVFSASYLDYWGGEATVAQGPRIDVTAASQPVSPPTTGSFVISEVGYAEFGEPISVKVAIPFSPSANDFLVFDGKTLVGRGQYRNGDWIVLPGLSVGVHDLTLVYDGETPTTVGKVQVVVEKGQTDVALESSVPSPYGTGPRTAVRGAPLSFMVRVAGGGSPPPTGTVTFYANGVAIGTAGLVNEIAVLAWNDAPLGTYIITASYSGDDNYATSSLPEGYTSNPLVQRVVASAQAAYSYTELSVSSVPLTPGQAFSLTALVESEDGSGTPLTGIVRFYEGTRLLGVGTVVDGQAVLSVVEGLAAGVHGVRAIYSGDTAYATSETLFELSVAKVPVAIGLSTSTGSVTQGQSVTLTAQVQGGALPANGVVSFFAGAQFLGTAEAMGGQATLVTSYLPVGSDLVLSASYGGNDFYAASVSSQGPVVQVVAGSQSVPPPVMRTMFLTASPSGTIGQALSLDMVISGAGAVSGGTYTVFNGQTLIGSYQVDPASPGRIQIKGLQAGWPDLTLIYTDGTGAPAAVAAQQMYISKGTVALGQVTSSRPVSVTGQPLTFTVGIRNASNGSFDGPPITGTVEIFDGGQTLGTVSLVNGVATLTVSNLPPGYYYFTVRYSGDANYEPHTSEWTAIRQEIAEGPQQSSVGLTLSQSPRDGEPLTLLAQAWGRGVPDGGTMSFYDGSTLLGTAVVANGLASFSLNGLNFGSHTLRAVYSGDANNAPSETTSVVLVAKARADLSNLSAASIAQDGALSVRVDRVDGANVGGVMSFYQGSHLLGTASVIDGVATLTGVSLPPGVQQFTAVYSGNANTADGELSFTQVVEGTTGTTLYVDPDAAEDRTASRLYDRDGRLQAVLDAEGYLTEYKYNAAGELVETIRYAERAANVATPAERAAALAIARASHSLTGLRPAVDADDIHSYNFYDARGRLVGQVDGEGYLSENVYDARGNITQTIRYANKAAAISSTSTLQSIRPAADSAQDQRTVQTWSAANQLLSRTNAEGTVTRFTYDSVGQLVQTVTAEGTADERTNRLRYDIQGRLIGELDGRGSDAVAQNDPLSAWADNGLTHSYDAAGRRTSTTDANGHRTLFFYDAIGRLAYTVNAIGEVTGSRYSAQGQLVEQVIYGSWVDVATLGATTPGGLNTATLTDLLAGVPSIQDSHVLNSYNATGTRASSTDALGHTTTYSYNAFREAIISGYVREDGYRVIDTASFDRRGLSVQSTRSNGIVVTTATYDAFGRLVESFDGNGNRSQFAYDRLGRTVVTTDALDAQRVTTYDAFDRVLTQRDTLNHVTSYSYDLANRSTTVTTPEGVSMITVHNRQGQTQSLTDGRGNTTIYSYDKSGNLLHTEAPEGVATDSTYDNAGLKLSSTDANGVRTDYTYDAANRLLTRTLDPDGLNLVTTYGYDAKGQGISVTDPRGIETLTEFDLAGRTVRQVVDPAGLALETSYTYDTNGTVLSVVDPNGVLTEYTYDGLGRRIREVLDPYDMNLITEYVYDGAGNVLQATDANGHTTRYVYDANNRRIFTVDPLGDVSRTRYDSEGRVVETVSYVHAISTQVLDEFIELGLPLRIADVDEMLEPDASSDLVQSRRYDADGRLHFTVDGTGAVVEYRYDTANNLIETRAYANRIDRAAWTLDVDPPVVPDAARDERVRAVFDGLNRKTWQVDGVGGAARYFYDANGNTVETRIYANALDSATFNAWDGLSAPAIVSDDARDQRLRAVFDAANRVTWQVDGAGGVVHVTYDAASNVVEKRAYANALGATALAAWDGHAAPSPQLDATRDQRTRNVYDAAGRLTWSVDGAGGVTKNEYDSNGNLILRRQYENAIASGASPDSVQISEMDRFTGFIYDAANRLEYQSRWRGDSNDSPYGPPTDSREEISFDYDGVGRLLRKTVHAPLSYWDPLGWVDEYDKQDHHNYFVYDAAGRLTYTVDAENAVTRNSYDGAGRLVRTEQYATPVEGGVTRMYWEWEDPQDLPRDRTLSGRQLSFAARSNEISEGRALPNGQHLYARLTSQKIESWLQYDASADRVTAMAYDAAGRRTFTVDAMGGVTRNAYDAFGNVTEQVSYANRIEAPDSETRLTEAGLEASVVTDSVADRVSRFAFDQMQRQVLAIDALGGLSERIYDGIGQVIETRRYAHAIDTAGLDGTASPDDLRSLLVSDPSADRVSRQVFDAAGRSIYGVDALGFVSKTDYDGLGQVRGTTQYARPISTGTANTAAAVALAVVTSPDDRSKSFDFDALGHVVFSVDALGSTESWTYDALGNKTSYTNAKGAVWTYEYDGLARMIREVSPQVDLTTVKAGDRERLGLDAQNSGMGSVVTVMQYDVFSNMTSRTEAQGRPEERTTYCEYDRLGRQLRVEYPEVTTAQTEGPVRLHTETTYDAFGNAIANLDVAGNYSYKTYDVLGRLVHEVDALGYVTGYQRNAFGEAITLTRYAQVTTASVQNPWWDELDVPSAADVALALPLSDADRTILTTYDRLGRAIEVKEPSAAVYDASAVAGAQYTFGGKATRNTYDSFGDLVQVAQHQAANSWVLTSNFYDRRGQQIASVDALGYLTTQVFDATGNVVDRTEFAKSLAGWVGTSSLTGWTGKADDSAGGTPPEPTTVDADNDRRVVTAYDRNNRKISETRMRVEYSTASNGISTRGDLTTTYGYDAVGNLTRTTDAAGASTYSYYDALGRVRAVAEPTRISTTSGAPITPLTVFRRDAYGNVVSKTEYVNGADGNGNPLSPNPMPDYMAIENPELATLRGAGYVDINDIGYVSATEFPGSKPLYRLQGTFYSWVNAYTTDESERAFDIASGAWKDGGIVGYVADEELPGTVPLYRLHQFSPPWAYTQLVSDPATIQALEATGWGEKKLMGYVSATPTATLDTSLHHMQLAITDPLLGLVGAQNHIYLPSTVKTDWDPVRDAELIANTDRTSYALYDALGHVVQSTDAMRVNHHSTYTQLGQVAEEWQDVTDNNGVTRKLRRAYEYDALGRQTHVYTPGAATDGADLTGSTTKPSPAAVITPGRYSDGFQIPTQPIVESRGSVVVAANTVIDPAGGAVRIVVDYITAEFVYTTYDETTHVTTREVIVPSRPESLEAIVPANNPVAILAPFAPKGPLASVTRIRVFQADAQGNWVERWGGPAEYASGITRTVRKPEADGLYTVAPTLTTALGSYTPQAPTAQDPDGINRGYVDIGVMNLLEGRGTSVRIQFDYVTPSQEVPGDEDGPPQTIAGHSATYTSAEMLPGEVGSNRRLVPDEPIGELQKIRVQQQIDGLWVTLWAGTPAEATGTQLHVGDEGFQVDTAMEYNAFGEVVSKSVNGQAGEYFDYDNAGHLWRTNAGDGVDKVALYDQLGRQTAEIRSAGSARGNLDLGNLNNATEANQLADVRRTDTTYDLLGRVIVQASAERAPQDNPGALARPVVNQNVDRWGNVVSISDPRSTGWVTHYRYNANNQLITQIQTDADGNAGVDGNGDISNVNAPVTRLYYDAVGRQVAVRDANDHVNGQEWDAGGNLVREVHADGGAISHAYNAFGNKVRTVDAMGQTSWFLNDKLDRLTRTSRGAGTDAIVENQRWDQAGRKLSQTNGAGNTIKYDYDLRGNLIRTTQPMGQTTQAGYDEWGHKVIEIDANGSVAAWKYDYFGQLQGRTDIGGADYAFSYDNARQLLTQTNTRGQNLGYAYDAAGQLVRIEDNGAGQPQKVTSYDYDLAGRHLRETTVQGGVTYQDNDLAYDALGRMRWVNDGRALVDVDYDKVGNRTHVSIHVHDQALNPALDQDVEQYFQYDEMNRQTVVNALDANGTLGTEGHVLGYDKNGRRTSDMHNGPRVVMVNGQWTPLADNGATTETYTYDSLDRLKTTTRDGAQIDTRTYDGAGRVLVSGTMIGVGGVDMNYINAHNLLNGGQLPVDLAGGPLRGDINAYDANGRLVGQISNSVGVTPVSAQTQYQYDAAGNMVRSQSAATSMPPGGPVSTSQSVEETWLQRAEGYQVQLRRTGSTTALGGLGYGYDANGYLVQVSDAGETIPSEQQHRFVNDAQGNVLYAYYTSSMDPNTQYNGQRQVVVNGEMLGRYGQTMDQRFPQGNPFQPGSEMWKPEVAFSFGYQPIDGNYPAGSPGTYAVQVNDTLQSIAKGAYGDANLWYLIADANGLMSNADLRAGQVLTVSARVTSANNANTFKPYDPSKIANDTPTMTAKPQDEKGCGAVGQIIVAVISVVVAVYTGGIGGAMLGSVVGQAAGVAMGVQDTISWKQVALAGVSAGVSAGLGEVMPTPLGGVATDIPNVVVRAAVGSALTQGIGVATGLQNKFSWRGVVAAAAGAGVGQAISTAIGGMAGSDNYARFDDEGNLMPGASPNDGGRYYASAWANSVSPAAARFVSGAVGGFAGGLTTAVMRGGKVSVMQVAADAFGNALGESLADAMGQSARTAGGANTLQADPLTLAMEVAPGSNADWVLERNDGTSVGPSGGAGFNFTDSEDGIVAMAQRAAYRQASANWYATSGMPAGAAPTSYTAQSGEGPLAIADGIDPTNRYAIAAFIAGSGQASYSASANRWITTAGQTYNADLSRLNADQIAQLDRAGRQLTSAESSIDSRREALRQAQAAQAVTYRNENYSNEGLSRPTYVATIYDDTQRMLNRMWDTPDGQFAKAYYAAGAASVAQPVEGGGFADSTNRFSNAGANIPLTQAANFAVGAAELVIGGGYNGVVRILGGVASIPYTLAGTDAAVGVQEGFAESWGYNPRSDGARAIMQGLAPVAQRVGNGLQAARDFTSSYIGDGATTVLFGGVQFALEAGATVTGLRALGGMGEALFAGRVGALSEVANAPPPLWGACFLPGTLVHTKQGTKLIELVEPGDLVAARNQFNQQTQWRPVLQVFASKDKDVVHVQVEHPDGAREIVSATTEHPFFVTGQGWRGANSLQPGDSLELLDGAQSRVIEVTPDDGKHLVYNFEVADDHTYFVGERGVWVHNTSSVSDALLDIKTSRAQGGLVRTRADSIIDEANRVAAAGGEISPQQRLLLQQNSPVVQRRNPIQNGFARTEFERDQSYLIRRWEENTGATWPTRVDPDGRLKLATPHHIYPLESGGANKWWNLMPTFGQLPNHSLPGIAGPHAAGGVLRSTIQGGPKQLPYGRTTDLRQIID